MVTVTKHYYSKVGHSKKHLMQWIHLLEATLCLDTWINQDEFLLSEADYVNKLLPAGSFKLIKPDYLLINDNKIKASVSFKGRLKRLKSFINSNTISNSSLTHILNEVAT